MTVRMANQILQLPTKTDRRKAANAELVAALEKAVARQGFSNDELISARAALAKHKKETT